MTVWIVAAAVLLVLGLGPALYFSSRGTALQRLVGLQLAGLVGVLVLIAVSEAAGESIYLIVPFVLALLTVTGTLVFTRLLRQRRAASGGHHG